MDDMYSSLLIYLLIVPLACQEGCVRGKNFWDLAYMKKSLFYIYTGLSGHKILKFQKKFSLGAFNVIASSSSSLQYIVEKLRVGLSHKGSFQCKIIFCIISLTTTPITTIILFVKFLLTRYCAFLIVLSPTSISLYFNPFFYWEIWSTFAFNSSMDLFKIPTIAFLFSKSYFLFPFFYSTLFTIHGNNIFSEEYYL